MNPQLTAMLIDAAHGCQSAVELGCMLGEQLAELVPHVPHRLGVEPFSAYVELAVDSGAQYEIAMALDWCHKQAPASYDMVMAIDLLEHLERHDGLLLLAEMARIAGVVAVVYTPDGYTAQTAEESCRLIAKNNPALGYQFNALQEHRSGWTIDDLEWSGYQAKRVEWADPAIQGIMRKR